MWYQDALILNVLILVICHDFLLSAEFIQTPLFQKISPWSTIRVSKSLDPDQARHFVGPDLGPNSLQKLSAGDTGRQRVKILNNQ